MVFYSDGVTWLLSLAGGVAVGALSASLVWRGVVRRAIIKIRDAERRARAAERLADAGAMTGGLAHEIKNPLSTIGLNAQLLAEGIGELEADADTKGRLSRRVDSLKREADRLRGILTDFLEYAGGIKLERRPCELSEVVDELIDFFLPQAAQAGIRLRSDLSPTPVPVFADPAVLKQALLNLLLNAVQAMQHQAGGGEIFVRTRVQPDAAREPWATVTVIDTGPGMAPEVLAKMFQPYFTTKAGGSGLGLPTSKRLIEAHGGRIDVHSERSRGTAFTIWLPARAERAATPVPHGTETA